MIGIGAMVAAILLLLPGIGEGALPGEKVLLGEIEGAPITLESFKEALRHDPLRAFERSARPEFAPAPEGRPELKRHLEEYLTNEVLYREAVHNGFPAAPEVAADLAVTMRSFTIEYFRASLQAEAQKQVTISDEDLAAFGTNYLVELVGISFNPGIPDEEKRARRAAEEIRKLLADGAAEFDQVVGAYLEQRLAASQAGFLAEKYAGWLAAPDLPPVLGAEIQKLKDGDVSRVIRSGARYMVFRLKERRKLSAREAGSDRLLQARIAGGKASMLLQQDYQRMFERHMARIAFNPDNLYDRRKYGETLIGLGDFYRIDVYEFLERVNQMKIPTVGQIGATYFVDPANRQNAERFIQIYFISPLIYYLEGKERKLDELPDFRAAYDYRRRVTIAQLYLQHQRQVFRQKLNGQCQEIDLAEERLAFWQKSLWRKYGARMSAELLP
ncbi:MAG: peptidylprolyl isomerase [Firmicutes bacterium]|nr:peptidylprolyl isomerase [Bacillota bacterium]